MYTLKEIKFQEWEEKWKNCQHVNLLQSWQYGDAKQIAENWKAYRFIMLNKHGDSIALTQVLLKKIPIFGIVARINRGPLIHKQLEKQKQETITLNAIDALITECRKKGWRMLQIAPELNGTKVVINRLKNLGLRQLSKPAWASGLLSLNKSEDELLMGLNGKWRNCLRKGWRSDISIKNIDINTQNLQKVLDRFKNFKQERKFKGISESLLRALALQNCDSWEFNIFIAKENYSDEAVKPIGTLVSVRYGDTTIYLMVTTNFKGRMLNSNYSLLWTAILSAKNKGCEWFDIGGLNKTTPPGIAHFKKGLNAESYILTGEWRLFNFPWAHIKKK